MDLNPTTNASCQCSVAPWLSVRNSASAVEFYKSALGATEVYRLGGPDDDVIARLSVNGAEFWVSGESPEHGNFSPETLGGGTVRLILTVPDPDAVFAQRSRRVPRKSTPSARDTDGAWDELSIHSGITGKLAGRFDRSAPMSQMAPKLARNASAAVILPIAGLVVGLALGGLRRGS